MLPLTQPRLPLVLFASLFVACATTQASYDNRDSQLSSKIGADIFIEYGLRVDLMVGARAARYRDGSAYMPLEIGGAEYWHPTNAGLLLGLDGAFSVIPLLLLFLAGGVWLLRTARALDVRREVP